MGKCVPGVVTVGNRAWMAEREKMRAWSGDRGKPCLDEGAWENALPGVMTVGNRAWMKERGKMC